MKEEIRNILKVKERLRTDNEKERKSKKARCEAGSSSTRIGAKLRDCKGERRGKKQSRESETRNTGEREERKQRSRKQLDEKRRGKKEGAE